MLKRLVLFILVSDSVYSFGQQKILNTALEKDTIVAEPAVPATFQEGKKAFATYIKKNLKYPSVAEELGIEGTVYVSYVVTKLGEVKDVEVINGISPECDEAARTIVAESPRWHPARAKNGMPVHTRMVVPVEFKLSQAKTYDIQKTRKNNDMISDVAESIEWSEGSLLLNDGTELKGVVKYNDNTGLLSYQNGADSRSFLAKSVVGFEYWDETIKSQRVFYSFDYVDAQAGTNKRCFFEALKEFKTFALLSKIDPVGVSRKYNNNGYTDPISGMYTNSGSSVELSQKETLFLMSRDGKIEPYVKITDTETNRVLVDTWKTKTKMLDDDLLAKYVGEEMYEKLRAFAKEQGLKFRIKKDLLTILGYYGELAK
ncbi:MAG: energy transducer TonB [Bacteroidota bacterium]